MSNDKTIRRIIIVTVVCIVYIVVTSLYYHIDKYLTGAVFIFLTLLFPITFIAMFVYTISGLRQIVLNRQNLTFMFCLPTIIALTTIVYSVFSPWQLNSEVWESKVALRACYEGTQNQSYIKFREDKSFEVHSTGVFFADFWDLGYWDKRDDTIFMWFSKNKPKLLSDTIIIHKEYLIPVTEVHLADSLKKYMKYYYLGYCKGLN